MTRRFASPLSYLDYFDPFNNECRAYGRLSGESRQDVAVRAHGYLFLIPEQEAFIAKNASSPRTHSDSDSEFEWTSEDDAQAQNNDGLNGPGRWHRFDVHRGVPVRAIVKDFATAPEAFTPDEVGDMWRDLEDLHKLGILVCDIRVSNCLGGKLIDFSRAWTVTHPSLEYISPYELGARPCYGVILRVCRIWLLTGEWEISGIGMRWIFRRS
jgi:hypothetical protein